MRAVVDTRCRSIPKVDLCALMAVCETNYWRLRKLLLPFFSELHEQAEFIFAIPAVDQQSERRLAVKVLERCPYTTILRFTEPGPEPVSAQWGLSPALTVRIYHDAKTAEVTAFQGQHNFRGHYEYPNPQMRQRDEKFQLNNLLADWLNHCLHYGYRIT